MNKKQLIITLATIHTDTAMVKVLLAFRDLAYQTKQADKAIKKFAELAAKYPPPPESRQAQHD